MPVTYDTFGTSYDSTTYEGDTLTYDGVVEEEEPPTEIPYASSTSGGGRGGSGDGLGGWITHPWYQGLQSSQRQKAVDLAIGYLLLTEDD